MMKLRKRRPKFKRQPRSEVERHVDALIGARVRDIRIARGVSLKQLAKKIGITYQQVQKYEKGTNRIGIGKLFLICRVLDVDLLEVFEDVDLDMETKGLTAGEGLLAAEPKDVLKTASMISNIKRPSIRRSFRALSKAIIENES